MQVFPAFCGPIIQNFNEKSIADASDIELQNMTKNVISYHGYFGNVHYDINNKNIETRFI